MRVIVRGRQQGKTVDIIRAAADYNGYIVCCSFAECSRVFYVAKELGVDIHFPISFSEFVDGRFGPFVKEFHIDNVDMLLQQFARFVPIGTVTLNGACVPRSYAE